MAFSIFERLKHLVADKAQDNKDFWVDDSKCKACYECDTPFSLFVRRHHCRVCGRIFCANCTRNFLFPGKGERSEPVPSRVCNFCYRLRRDEGEDASGRGSRVAPVKRPSVLPAPLPEAQPLVRKQQAPVWPPPNKGELAQKAAAAESAAKAKALQQTARPQASKDVNPHSGLATAAGAVGSGTAARISGPIASGVLPSSSAFAQPSRGLPPRPNKRAEAKSKTAAKPRRQPSASRSRRVRRDDALTWDVPPALDMHMEEGGDAGHLAGSLDECDGLQPITAFLRVALTEVAQRHLAAVVVQLLVAEGVHNVTSWGPAITRLACEAAAAISPPAVAAYGVNDPRFYIKVKRVANVGTPEDSAVVHGLVCRKNVAHRRMQTHVDQPRIMMLGSTLEYQRTAHKLSSFDTLLDQEREHLRLAVERVAALKPQVLLVEKSVARYAQDALLHKGISLVLNVKPALLERIARCTGAQLAPSIEHLNADCIASCREFYVETIQQGGTGAGSSTSSSPRDSYASLQRMPSLADSTQSGHADGKRGAAAPGPKTLMYFKGCPHPLGCTILLKGGSQEELTQVKRVMQFAAYAAYHSRLETAFLADELASAKAAMHTQLRASGDDSAPATLDAAAADQGGPGNESADADATSAQEAAGADGSGARGALAAEPAHEPEDDGGLIALSKERLRQQARHIAQASAECSLLDSGEEPTLLSVSPHVTVHDWKHRPRISVPEPPADPASNRGAMHASASTMSISTLAASAAPVLKATAGDRADASASSPASAAGRASAGDAVAPAPACAAGAEFPSDVAAPVGTAAVADGPASEAAEASGASTPQLEQPTQEQRPTSAAASEAVAKQADSSCAHGRDDCDRPAVIASHPLTEADAPQSAHKPQAAPTTAAALAEPAATAATVAPADESASGKLQDYLTRKLAATLRPPSSATPFAQPPHLAAFLDPIPDTGEVFCDPLSQAAMELGQSLGSDSSAFFNALEDALLPLNESASAARAAAGLLYSRQRLYVSIACRNPIRGLLCEPPAVQRIEYYRGSDVPLATFLAASAPQPHKQCPQAACGDGATSHLRTFLHGTSRITLSVTRLTPEEALPGAKDGQVWFWARPFQEDQGPAPTARRIALSPEASCLSIGHFLELSFGAHHLAVEGRAVHAGFVRYFGLGSTVACFHHERVHPNSVHLPDAQIAHSVAAQQQWLQQEVEELSQEAYAAFSAIEHALHAQAAAARSTTLSIQGDDTAAGESGNEADSEVQADSAVQTVTGLLAAVGEERGVFSEMVADVATLIDHPVNHASKQSPPAMHKGLQRTLNPLVGMLSAVASASSASPAGTRSSTPKATAGPAQAAGEAGVGNSDSHPAGQPADPSTSQSCSPAELAVPAEPAAPRVSAEAWQRESNQALTAAVWELNRLRRSLIVIVLTWSATLLEPPPAPSTLPTRPSLPGSVVGSGSLASYASQPLLPPSGLAPSGASAVAGQHSRHPSTDAAVTSPPQADQAGKAGAAGTAGKLSASLPSRSQPVRKKTATKGASNALRQRSHSAPKALDTLLPAGRTPPSAGWVPHPQSQPSVADTSASADMSNRASAGAESSVPASTDHSCHAHPVSAVESETEAEAEAEGDGKADADACADAGSTGRSAADEEASASDAERRQTHSQAGPLTAEQQEPEAGRRARRRGSSKAKGTRFSSKRAQSLPILHRLQPPAGERTLQWLLTSFGDPSTSPVPAEPLDTSPLATLPFQLLQPLPLESHNQLRDIPGREAAEGGIQAGSGSGHETGAEQDHALQDSDEDHAKRTPGSDDVPFSAAVLRYLTRRSAPAERRQSYTIDLANVRTNLQRGEGGALSPTILSPTVLSRTPSGTDIYPLMEGDVVSRLVSAPAGLSLAEPLLSSSAAAQRGSSAATDTHASASGSHDAAEHDPAHRSLMPSPFSYSAPPQQQQQPLVWAGRGRGPRSLAAGGSAAAEAPGPRSVSFSDATLRSSAPDHGGTRPQHAHWSATSPALSRGAAAPTWDDIRSPRGEGTGPTGVKAIPSGHHTTGKSSPRSVNSARLSPIVSPTMHSMLSSSVSDDEVDEEARDSASSVEEDEETRCHRNWGVAIRSPFAHAAKQKEEAEVEPDAAPRPVHREASASSAFMSHFEDWAEFVDSPSESPTHRHPEPKCETPSPPEPQPPKPVAAVPTHRAKSVQELLSQATAPAALSLPHSPAQAAEQLSKLKFPGLGDRRWLNTAPGFIPLSVGRVEVHGRALLPAGPDLVVIVRDDEPTSLIAYALATREHQSYLDDAHATILYGAGRPTADGWGATTSSSWAARSHADLAAATTRSNSPKAVDLGDAAASGPNASRAGRPETAPTSNHSPSRDPQVASSASAPPALLPIRPPANPGGMAGGVAAESRAEARAEARADSDGPNEWKVLMSAERFDFRHSVDDESPGMPWARAKLQVVAYYAPQFGELRRRCCAGGERAFLASLSRCRKWTSRGGKSGSYFAKTRDDRYVVKQLSKSEKQSFLEFAPSYFRYLGPGMAKGQQTCLAKILGVYQVSVKAASGASNGSGLAGVKDGVMDLLIMENIFYARDISRIYDLKGSERSRYAADDPADATAVLMDENLRESNLSAPILVNQQAYARLERALWNDTSFLSSLGVMDYSMLVGVDKHEHVLVVGIIDFVRQYTWDKQLETWVKSAAILGSAGKEPTVISPKQYCRRFRIAMASYFTCVPSGSEDPAPPLNPDAP